MTSDERERLLKIHHDVSNALTIVRVSLEGMSDGVIPATPQNVAPLLESLSRASRLLDALRAEQ